jgi:glyoxylase-like metal-dependent hydrolase (beta-lactamase superfamily II)
MNSTKFFSFILCALTALLTPQTATSQSSTQSTLRIYFIDVEGGQSTLFVTPAGQSLLIDTGWSGNNFRDADRIAAAAKEAGLKQIDCVLLTHYHADHIGGIPQLVSASPSAPSSTMVPIANPLPESSTTTPNTRKSSPPENPNTSSPIPATPCPFRE